MPVPRREREVEFEEQREVVLDQQRLEVRQVTDAVECRDLNCEDHQGKRGDQC